MRVHPLAFGLVACAPLTFAVPASPSNSLKSRAAVSDCPGYEASNVVKSDSGLTADLTLAGDACNAFGTDLKDLKLVVEHQSSKYSSSQITVSFNDKKIARNDETGALCF